MGWKRKDDDNLLFSFEAPPFFVVGASQTSQAIFLYLTTNVFNTDSHLS
jgi:hypothetical protein